MPTIIETDKPIIKTAIGPSCKIFTATIVKLFVSYPNPRLWNDTNKVGAIVLFRDEKRKGAPFFSLVDLVSGQVVWEHEIYKNFVYYEDAPFFHSFPSDKFMIGFSFADQNEASQFKAIVLRKLDMIFNANVVIPTIQGPSVAKPQPITTVNSSTTVPKSTSSSSGGLFSAFSSSSSSKKKKKISKADIGRPSDFRHVGHIGFDPNSGFDIKNIPEEWRALFDKAGVTREQLENKETAKFIYDFVQKQGGIGAGGAGPGPSVSSQPPPPIPSTSSGSSKGRAPPPPVPTAPVPAQRQGPPAIPARNTVRGPPPAAPPRPNITGAGGVFSVPSNSGAPPPPPPPPPIPSSIPGPGSAPVVPVKRSTPLPPPVKDGRSELLDSIRGGVQLKKISDSISSSGSRDIAASASNNSTSEGDKTDLMANLLAAALQNRNLRMAHSDSEDDGDDNDDDDEW